ncbi:hypothetical protein WAI453_009222 [Rhynchosporium graminicola]
MSDFTNHRDDIVPSIETQSKPTTTTTTNSGLQNAMNSVGNNASAAADAVKNHPITQNIANGPVAENIKDQTAKTSSEFSNLAATRTTPATPAATGQQLTHYHSFFSSLLSWEHPRASGIAYLAIVSFIFAARYLDIIRYSFKLTYMVLGVTVLAEAVGQAAFSTGFTSQVRPKKYYTVSKDTLHSLIGDVHELVNFFVIEAQQIVFAENLLASGAAFVAAFISYYLIKIVPFWGMSLIATSVLFLTPLIYKTNKQLIDENLARASSVINQQSQQVKHLASQQAARATETTKSFVGDYSAKAQEIIGSARGRSVSPTASAKPAKTEPFSSTASSKTTKVEPFNAKENVPSAYKSEDFPAAPINSAYKVEDFPAAPVQDFKSSAPVVADRDFKSASSNVDEPLIV